MAADKKPKPEDQPTLEERFTLMTQQRDSLVKEVGKLNAIKEAEDSLALIQNSAGGVATKYDCAAFRPDFTCIKKTKEEKKDEKEAAKDK